MAFDKETGLYTAEDIVFTNTREFQRSGMAFLKDGVYCKAPEGSRDHEQFWDIEEDRLKNGMTLPGKLKDGKLEDIHISGSYYGFLNYGLIQRTERNDSDELSSVIKMSSKEQKSATKVRTLPDFWDGHWQLDHAKQIALKNGLHFVGGKARRKGFSFLEGFEAALTVNMNPFTTTVLGAYELKYLTGARRIMNMAKSYLDHFELHTDFNRGFLLQDISKLVEMGYKEEGSNIKMGFQSMLLPVTFKDNTDASRGLDAKIIKLDECQTFPNLLPVLKTLLPTLKAGNLVTGQLSLWGTGGDSEKGANWEPFETVYYNPKGYNMLAYKNIWDEGMDGDIDGCGLFFPHYQNLEPFIDKHGNSDIVTAKQVGEAERIEKKKTVGSIKEYVDFVSEWANCGKECFVSSASDIFPDVNNQIHRVKNDSIIKNIERVGKLVRTDKGIKFIDSDKHPAIDNFPLKKGDDVVGAIRFWQMPYRDNNGNIPLNLYRVWNDPYAIDKDKDFIKQTDSLGATYIYERENNFTATRGDIIIGEYIGRPERQEDYNDNLILITEFVNGILQFENDRGDIKKHFQKRKKIHLLADEPDFNWKKEISGKHGRSKGISMSNAKRIGTAAIYFRDWLNRVRSKGEDEVEVKNLDYIYSLGLLKEISKWNHKGNFDRVSCCLVGQFDIEEVFDKKIVARKEIRKSGLFADAINGNLYN